MMLPGSLKAKKLTEVADAEKMLKTLKEDTPQHTALKATIALLKKVTKEERETFNKNLSEMVNKAASFAKASNKLDTDVRALAK